MQKLWVSLCVGQNQGVGGRGWGSRGWGDTWKCIQVGPTHRWLSVGGGGLYVHMYTNVSSDRGTK